LYPPPTPLLECAVFTEGFMTTEDPNSICYITSCDIWICVCACVRIDAPCKISLLCRGNSCTAETRAPPNQKKVVCITWMRGQWSDLEATLPHVETQQTSIRLSINGKASEWRCTFEQLGGRIPTNNPLRCHSWLRSCQTFGGLRHLEP
jgi:hypothetical protein